MHKIYTGSKNPHCLTGQISGQRWGMLYMIGFDGKRYRLIRSPSGNVTTSF